MVLTSGEELRFGGLFWPSSGKESRLGRLPWLSSGKGSRFGGLTWPSLWSRCKGHRVGPPKWSPETGIYMLYVLNVFFHCRLPIFSSSECSGTCASGCLSSSNWWRWTSCLDTVLDAEFWGDCTRGILKCWIIWVIWFLFVSGFLFLKKTQSFKGSIHICINTNIDSVLYKSQPKMIFYVFEQVKYVLMFFVVFVCMIIGYVCSQDFTVSFLIKPDLP